MYFLDWKVKDRDSKLKVNLWERFCREFRFFCYLITEKEKKKLLKGRKCFLDVKNGVYKIRIIIVLLVCYEGGFC